ncbi:MAG: xanthine dehydrogenase family protein subunit M [Gemmatimonadetes bacterium]|nr:xanthine dehydrogenase family protein subunit M [Gemmatimonadota bacterium]
MLKDMMSHFELYQPADLDQALELADRFGRDGWALAGGHDSLGWFKDRAKHPQAMIDLARIDDLHGIRETADGGIEIGAMSTLTEVERHPLIQERFKLLADAVSNVASPQIRNTGTLGGNVCQDTRCWYYRAGLDCYRAGGNTCYADTPDAMNREHCLFGADRCVAVTPSDGAPALVALDAEMVIHNAGGERVVAAEDFFMEPGVDITRMTVLNPEDIVTSIRIPNTWAGAKFYFEKVADRNSWDFALLNVAAAMKVSGGVIEDVRIVCGAVECIPRRLTSVENLVKGRTQNDETAEAAGAAATRGAKPLNYNHFKVPLMQNLVKRAVRDA